MMLSVTRAREIMLADIATLDAVDIGLDAAHHHVLAAAVRAHRDQPPYDAAAMDGYAFRAADAPGPLAIVGESAAGRPFGASLPPRAAVRISTGAALPPGADIVVMQEDAQHDGAVLTVPAPDGQRHVRPSGSDFAHDSVLLAPGRRLSIGDVTLAAAAGVSRLRVARQPLVALLPGGDELAAPGSPATADQIYESASFGVAALARAWGAQCTRQAPLRDTPDAIAHAVLLALETHDLAVLIGGASVGPHDHGRATLAALGFDILVEKISVKPGKPTWYARGPRGAVLGLPGNPASALVCARLFLAPIIERFVGADAAAHLFRRTGLLSAQAPNGARESYWRAKMLRDADGFDALSVIGDQDSSLTTVLSAADVLVRQLAHCDGKSAGDEAEYLEWTPR